MPPLFEEPHTPATVGEWLDEQAANIAHALRADDEEVVRVLADCAGWEPEQEPDHIGRERLQRAAGQLGELTGADPDRVAHVLFIFGYQGAASD